MKITICIPTWEQYGKGVGFLMNLLNTILNQTYQNINIVISDHSENDNIKNVCSIFGDRLNITYIKNERDRGNGPANTNNTIVNADGDIIKIMFQDDFFYKKNALELIAKSFEDPNCNWLVNGCNHTYDNGQTFINNMIPKWNDDIILGVNTISSPSVLSFRRSIDILFDKKLVMFMDCDFYQQLYLKFGLPKVLSNYLITNRMHPNQISSIYDTNNLTKELNYLKQKYKL